MAGETSAIGPRHSVTPDRVEFELGEELPQASSPRITLLMAVFKFDRMEWAIEKCTELGVTKIIPIIARRTDSHLAHASVKRVERWQRIAQQAAEQSRRTATPNIEAPIKLSAAAQMTATTRIVLSENERKLSLKDALAAHSPAEELLLACGPEGGWSEEELASFSKSGLDIGVSGQHHPASRNGGYRSHRHRVRRTLLRQGFAQQDSQLPLLFCT